MQSFCRYKSASIILCPNVLLIITLTAKRSYRFSPLKTQNLPLHFFIAFATILSPHQNENPSLRKKIISLARNDFSLNTGAILLCNMLIWVYWHVHKIVETIFVISCIKCKIVFHRRQLYTIHILKEKTYENFIAAIVSFAFGNRL